MKKMLIAVALVLTAGIMASCNQGEGCYRLDWKVKVAGIETKGTSYVYGDGQDIDKAKKELKDLYEGIEITQTKVAKSKDDCEKAN